jgi:hypothetical protein
MSLGLDDVTASPAASLLASEAAALDAYVTVITNTSTQKPFLNGTVKTHIQQTLKKLGLQKRTHLANYLQKDQDAIRAKPLSLEDVGQRM